MKKNILILALILATGLFSFAGTYYGPKVNYISGGMPSTIGEDVVTISVSTAQRYYLNADIYSMNCRDIDVEGWISMNTPSGPFYKSVHAKGTNYVADTPVDKEQGKIPNSGNLKFNWHYNIASGNAYINLFLYIY